MPTEKEIREREEKMEAMKKSLEDTVDINYGRYNNKYVDLAYERELINKEIKQKSADKKVKEAIEESADRLYGVLRGTINI